MNQLQMINRMLWGGVKSILETDTSLWLKADNPLNTNTRWYDASPNNHVLTGSATLADNVLNGQKGYVFNSTSNYFDGGDILDVGVNSKTVIIIAKSASQTFSPFIGKFNGGGDSQWLIETYGNQYYGFVMKDSVQNLCPPINQSLSKNIGVFQIIKFRVDRINSVLGLKIDNTTEKTIPFSYAYDFNTTVNLMVGRWATYYLNGTICEIIVFDRLLTTSENTEVNAYLLTKYGL